MSMCTYCFRGPSVYVYLLDVAPLNAVYDLFFCPVDVVRVVVDVELGNLVSD